MILIQVKIEVLDFSLLEAFERQAVKIMTKYQGKMLAAFETTRDDSNRGWEFHLLEFPSLVQFANYRNDSELATLVELRTKAIASTEVNISTKIKSYE